MSKPRRYEDDEATFEREQWTPDAQPEPEDITPVRHDNMGSPIYPWQETT